MQTQMHFPGLVDVDNLVWSDVSDGAGDAARGRRISHHTIRTYKRLSHEFVEWCASMGKESLPASTDAVAEYLTYLGTQGLRTPTLRAARSAIAYVHRRTGHEDPTAAPVVTETLRGLGQADGRPGSSARPLTQTDFLAIRESACNPREVSGMVPRMEDLETARERGLVDVAVISLMRELGLRRSEAAALRWDGVSFGRDGDATLVVRGQERLPISEACSRDLEAIRPFGGASSHRVFGLSPGQIGRRIRAVAKNAGLGDGYTGQSCRIGVAQDMAREGKSIRSVMEVGRWRFPQTPTRYMLNSSVSRR